MTTFTILPVTITLHYVSVILFVAAIHFSIQDCLYLTSLEWKISGTTKTNAPNKFRYFDSFSAGDGLFGTCEVDPNTKVPFLINS